MDARGDKMKELRLFSHLQIADNVYVITENYDQGHRFTIGLVVGKEKALVIDAGLGMAGDLRAYIEKIIGSELPITCVCTHGHSDVAGGVAAFDVVYLNEADAGAYPETTDMEERIQQMGFFSAQNPEIIAYGKQYAKDNADTKFRELKDGDYFDLGGFRADIIGIPGHTGGSVMVRVTDGADLKLVFCGDTPSSGMNHLMDMDKEQMSDFGSRLKGVLEKMDADTQIYSTHSSVPMTPRIAMAVAHACIEVAAGDTAEDPKYMNPFNPSDSRDLRTHYCENQYIVYNADLL